MGPIRGWSNRVGLLLSPGLIVRMRTIEVKIVIFELLYSGFVEPVLNQIYLDSFKGKWLYSICCVPAPIISVPVLWCGLAFLGYCFNSDSFHILQLSLPPTTPTPINSHSQPPTTKINITHPLYPNNNSKMKFTTALLLVGAVTAQLNCDLISNDPIINRSNDPIRKLEGRSDLFDLTRSLKSRSLKSGKAGKNKEKNLKSGKSGKTKASRGFLQSFTECNSTQGFVPIHILDLPILDPDRRLTNRDDCTDSVCVDLCIPFFLLGEALCDFENPASYGNCASVGYTDFSESLEGPTAGNATLWEKNCHGCAFDDEPVQPQSDVVWSDYNLLP